MLSVLSQFSHFVVCGSSHYTSVVLQSVLSTLPSGASVACGCCPGVPASVRHFFGAPVGYRSWFQPPSRSSYSHSVHRFGQLRVFAAASLGSRAQALGARSGALVKWAASHSALWLSFPATPQPSGLVPARSWQSCGSGTWSSLALAVGHSVPVLVFSHPVKWAGFYRVSSSVSGYLPSQQKSLF